MTISEVLSKKGYRLYRGVPFIDREEEIEFFKERFKEEPQKTLFVYGPKSTGKTTTIEYVVENHLLQDNLYNVKYINFRGKMVVDYDSFIDAIIEEKDDEYDKEEELNRNYNLLNAFRLEAKSIKKYKQKRKNLFDILLDEFKKTGKKNILIIDEIQILEDIYFNGEKELLKEFLNFCVRLTKELHISHVVILTSNTIFLNRIYNDSKLKLTSDFKLIGHPKKEIAIKLLKDLEYSDDKIDLALEYYGTTLTLLIKLYSYIKPDSSIDELKKYLESEALDAKMQIDEVLTNTKKYNLPKMIDDEFLIIADNIVKRGYFNYGEQDRQTKQKLLPVVEVFSEKEILFYNPQTGIITPNSKIYLKGMEQIVGSV